MRKTRSSRSISSSMAVRMASRYVVSLIPISIAAVQPKGGFLAARHRRALGLVGRGVDFAAHALLNLRKIGGDAGVDQRLLEPRDRVFRLPFLEHLGRHIRLIVMLGVALHPERDDFE